MSEAWTHGSHVVTESKHVSVGVCSKKTKHIVDFEINSGATLKS